MLRQNKGDYLELVATSTVEPCIRNERWAGKLIDLSHELYHSLGPKEPLSRRQVTWRKGLFSFFSLYLVALVHVEPSQPQTMGNWAGAVGAGHQGAVVLPNAQRGYPDNQGSDN